MEGFSLTAFLNDPAGLAVKGALIAAFLDFAFGVFAAFRDGTFALDSLAAFVRKHLLGRVLPVSLLAITAYVTGDAAMAAAAIGALGAYTVETLASIYGSVRPPAPSVVAESKPAETVNPGPQD
jgi:hypothetical protein